MRKNTLPRKKHYKHFHIPHDMSALSALHLIWNVLFCVLSIASLLKSFTLLYYRWILSSFEISSKAMLLSLWEFPLWLPIIIWIFFYSPLKEVVRFKVIRQQIQIGNWNTKKYLDTFWLGLVLHFLPKSNNIKILQIITNVETFWLGLVLYFLVKSNNINILQIITNLETFWLGLVL